MPDTPDPRNPMCNCGCWDKDFAAPNIDALTAAVVEAMENEGVVTWGDDGHRNRFLAILQDEP